ncbi:LuxR family transcriptional regulator [Streptomyces sp. NPDC050856]|uniref:helix-turn-helix transcriptional regulator n=1 Tax=Streptomyces sp. NPDC050856 TaxID=3154939 RepID=UPI003407BCE0
MTGKTIPRSSLRLYGRSAELAAVTALLDRLRSGRDGALLLTAEPGLGRSALLGRAARDFAPGAVAHTRAAPAESDLPHSGAHALLCAAAGSPGTAPADVLRSGLAPGALAEVLRARPGPLLVCVDDAHLWDDASRAALGFAARRAAATGPAAAGRHALGLLLSVAGHRADDPDFAGLPLVRLGPLPEHAAAALVDDLTGGTAEAAVREEILYEAEGNPALLRALTERLSPAQLAGHAPLPRPPADGDVLLPVFGGRLAGLPRDTLFLLLLAAAAHEPAARPAGADANAVLRAARAAGIRPGALDPAEAAGVAHVVGGLIRFASEPLRRTVLAGAPLSRRRTAHRLLAAALTGDGHRLSRLLHRALAADGPAPRLAADLAAAASGAGPGTGAGLVERSAALARAAELVTTEATRAARLVGAAELAAAAGRPRPARRLLAGVTAPAAPAAVRGRAELVRGTLLLADGPVGNAHHMLLVAARLLAPYDPRRARAARLAALDAAWAAGDVTACLAALGDGPGDGRLGDYWDGLRAVLDGRFEAARAPLRRAADAESGERDGAGAGGEEAVGGAPERLLRAGAAALVLGDSATACRAHARAVAVVQAHGPAGLLPRCLEHLAYAELRAGRHARAGAHAQEGLRAAHRLGQSNVVAHLRAVLALVASVEGDAAAVAGHAAAALAIARPHGLAQAATLAEWASARADLGRGRAFEAAARLAPLVRPGPRCGHFAVRMLAVPCFVEAAVAAGKEAQALAATEEFARWAALEVDPQAPAQLARCRALLAVPEGGGVPRAPAGPADALYADALARHEEAGGDFERGRTLLLYGKWLRRRRRPSEARDRLRDALVAFERSGAGAWAEQTRGELRATGEAAGGGPAGELARLTPQQLRIARCVAEGATNREVALRMSISPRTVDHHLRNVFALLRVRSRVELSRLVDRADTRTYTDPPRSRS